jgi:hypothetical protein
VAILSDYNNGDVAWYHVHDQHPNWVVKCPTLELVLMFDNLRQLGRSPGALDAIRCTKFPYDCCEINQLPEAIAWYQNEIIAGVPLAYKGWLSYVYEICGQKLLASDIEHWGKQPLRLLVSAHDLMIERKKAEAAASA